MEDYRFLLNLFLYLRILKIKKGKSIIKHKLKKRRGKIVKI